MPSVTDQGRTGAGSGQSVALAASLTAHTEKERGGVRMLRSQPPEVQRNQ